MKTKIISALLILFSVNSCSSGRKITVFSPDKTIKIGIDTRSVKENPGFTIEKDSRKIILHSYFNLEFNGIDLPDDLRIVKAEHGSFSNTWINSIGEKKNVPDNYNQQKVFLKSNDMRLNLIFRVYNEGAAFAWEFPEQEGLDSLIITDEKIIFRFPADYPAWSAPRAQALYSKVPVSKIDNGAERPLVIEIDSTLTIALTEANLVDFARMKFEPDSSSGTGIRTRLGSEVRKSIPFQSPWRVIMIGENPGDLLEKNYLLLNLKDPSRIDDPSWITP